MGLTVFINAGPWLPVPPSGYGGVENLLVYLINELRGRGHRVILGTVGQSRIEVEEQVSRYRQGQHPRIDGPYCDGVSVALAHMQRVLKTIRATPGIDVVHDFLEIVGPSTLAELEHGPPVLHTLQWNLWQQRDFYRHFDGRGRVWFNGISEPQMRAARGNLLRRSLGVVHNGVDVDDFTYRERKDDYAITLARFTYDKGQDVAARVCAKLGMPLQMAGTVGGLASPELLAEELARRFSPFHHYKDVQYYRRAVQPHEDPDRGIAWIGSVGGDAKRELVAGARALLMPIRWEEPFGMAVIEALASGTPVVAMRRGAMPLIIEHGRTGFLADDERQFAGYLRRVGEIDPAACRRSVRERFSAAAMAERYVRRYEEVIERARAARGPAAARRRGPRGDDANGHRRPVGVAPTGATAP
jgi:glycosyltransferase involved in cell wall biosynthesis